MKKLILFTSFAALLLVVAIGCGDDETATGSQLLIGDTTSEEFQFIDTNLGGSALDNIGNSLDLSFSLIDSIPAPQTGSKYDSPFGYAASDISVIAIGSYVYENGWHIFTFEASFVEDEDTTEVTGIDSIQITDDDTPLSYPDSTMNGIKIRKHFAVNNDYIDGTGDHSLDIDATNYEIDSTGTINGSGLETLEFYFADSNAVCTLSAANSVTINDVVLLIDSEEEDDCPLSGSVNLSAGLMLDCTGTGEGGLNNLSIDGSWSLNAVFNGSSTTITYSDNTTSWTITESCGSSGAVAAPLGGLAIKR